MNCSKLAKKNMQNHWCGPLSISVILSHKHPTVSLSCVTASVINISTWKAKAMLHTNKQTEFFCLFDRAVILELYCLLELTWYGGGSRWFTANILDIWQGKKKKIWNSFAGTASRYCCTCGQTYTHSMMKTDCNCHDRCSAQDPKLKRK